MLKDAISSADNGKTTVFGYYVNAPARFGIVELHDTGKVISME